MRRMVRPLTAVSESAKLKLFTKISTLNLEAIKVLRFLLKAYGNIGNFLKKCHKHFV